MGQQQLLLIVLGVIVVGIAIVVGINLFNQNSISSNRDAVISDLNNFAAQAMSYYKKPTSMGGGASKFTGFTFGNGQTSDSTANGAYSVSATDDACTFTGTGTAINEGGTNYIEYECVVDKAGIVSVKKTDVE